MKKLILLLGLTIIFTSTKSFAEEEKSLVSLTCAALTAQVLRDALPHGNDKFKHCTLSCQVARVCGISGTTAIGILKEVADLFGAGNAEIADLQADFRGIRLSWGARSNDHCANLCRQYYP